jgi:hypothetical protein
VQFKPQTTLAKDAKKSWLNWLKRSDVRHAPDVMKGRHLTGHLDFAALLDPSHTKRLLLLVTSFDEVKVAHFKDVQRQHAIREKALAQWEEGDGALHGLGRSSPSSSGFKFSVLGLGMDIFTPSHTCPHQHIPSALMMQVPVPQHLGSSVIWVQSKLNVG